ncbi:class I SAM-dependent methyltransferase [Patescibacteria group bacterium]|nr:class I SAM-dependent methyltransferase [Patescibacteria group bacterium]
MKQDIYNQEIKDWDANAKFYVNENFMPYQEKIVRKKMYKFYNIDKSQAVLEAGGGIVKLLKNSVLIDFSTKMIEGCKSINQAEKCVQGSVHDLPFENNSFDVVVANGLFHHIKVQGLLDKTCDEFFRVLKPSGKLCIFDRAPNLVPKLMFYVRQPLKLIHKPKSTCSTTNEVQFLESDIEKIISHGFKIEKRMYLINIFFQSMIILTNIFQYLFGAKAAIIVQRISMPLAMVVEKIFSFKFLCVEQCIIMKKQ